MYFLKLVAISCNRQIFTKSRNMDVLRHFQSVSWFKPDWCLPDTSKDASNLLHQCSGLPKVEFTEEVEDIIRKSNAFPIQFPIQSVRLEKLKERRSVEKLKNNAMSTYPLVHERVLLLMTQFLIYKRKYGSSIEKTLYKDMTVPEFIDRILKKRAVAFLGSEDSYMLLSGETGVDGWEAVGTPLQKPPLVLENCLSYDEMKLSAMVYVSGPTECINDGERYNRGLVKEDGIERDAIIIGIIGPRFEREGRMDCEDILITKKQNVPENGYGKMASTAGHNVTARQMWRQMWAEFYQVQGVTYEELTSSVDIASAHSHDQCKARILRTNPDTLFDNEVYYKRLYIIAESVLLEAEERACQDGRNAFLNVIGAGLGVWRISSHQTDVFVLSFLERIKSLLEDERLDHVTDVNFAYIRPSKNILEHFPNTSGVKKVFFENERHPKGGINVQLENREPSAKLRGEHEGKLLVMTYAWDGNAHPGNEFWTGSLDGSGDPAAACSTQVAELHNAYINPAVTGYRTVVAGNEGLKSLQEYCSDLTT